MYCRLLFVLLLLAGSVNVCAANAGRILAVPPISNDHHRYCLGLLKLALSYSDVSYEIEYSDDSLSQTRELQRIQDGKLDVIWLATPNKFEALARPVRVPLYRGLLGHRR